MSCIKLNLSIFTAAFCVFAGVVAGGCNEAVSESASDLAPSDGEQTAQSQQELDPIDPIPIPTCNPTSIAADRTFATAPGECQSNTATSIGDMYAEPFCSPYVVEYAYRPSNIGADWDHMPSSKTECEAMRANVTAHTFSNGAWVTNGTARYHGVWCEPLAGGGSGFCLERCEAKLDSGSSIPTFGAGTKWRASAVAYERNCGGSSCYNDYKRLTVNNSGPCVPE